VSCANCRDSVKDEIAIRVADMVGSQAPQTHLNGLRLATWASRGAVFHRDGLLVVPAKAPEHLADFWDDFARQNVKNYAAGIAAAAENDEGMLYASLRNRFRTVRQILTATGSDLTPLFTIHRAIIFGAMWTPYLYYLVGAATQAWGRAIHSGLPRPSAGTMSEDFAAVGEFLVSHPDPPWLSLCLSSRWEPVSLFSDEFADESAAPFKVTDAITYLGIAAAVLIAAEITGNRILPATSRPPLGEFSDLYPYILRRWDIERDAQLPDLPVTQHFQQLFRSWANKETDLVEHLPIPEP
jgi:hypothetical protein